MITTQETTADSEPPAPSTAGGSESDYPVLLKLRARANQLTEDWTLRNLALREIAVAYADLENDLSVAVDLSKFTAIRYDEVMRIMPSDEEMSVLCALTGPPPFADDKIRENRERLELLRKVLQRYREIIPLKEKKESPNVRPE